MNEDGLDFEDVASQTPAQDFDVAQSRDVGEYTVKLVQVTIRQGWNRLMLACYRASKFSNVRSLTLFFPASQGDDTTRVYYLGFLGEWSEVSSLPGCLVEEDSSSVVAEKSDRACRVRSTG